MPAGRQPIQIDKAQFEKLCALQCSQQEIADWFDCGAPTIANWVKRTYHKDDGTPLTFAEAFDRYSSHGKTSLRRYQFRLAEKNPQMAIWLGKQWLGQRDVVDANLPQAESAIENIARQILNRKVNE